MMSEDKHKPEIDKITGVETTGHEWDGLKELNNPLPRWWLWVWLVCCLWAVWYFVLYPAWPVPGGATEGTSGYTQFKELKESQAEIAARQGNYLERFEAASFDEILKDPALYRFAIAGGEISFKDNCAVCHGTGAAGGPGYPNLNDDDWLWAGDVNGIHQTLLHGIRADNDDARVSDMPAFGKDELLSHSQIDSVVDYVLSLSSHGEVQIDKHGHAVKPADLSKGKAIFAENCASCHGNNAKGGREFGAPNLTDPIWLYGGKRADVYNTVYYSRAGLMPAWKDRLDPQTIRQLTIYVHQLGGGE